MRLDLIQPFINAADAVLTHSLAGSTRVADVSMEQQAYHPRGFAAIISLKGDIEGRVVFDLAPETAASVAGTLSGGAVMSQAEMHEAICELANQVIGNAITTLNDRGFHFRVQPPKVSAGEDGARITEDTEALVMRFDTPGGPVFINIALRFPSCEGQVA